MLSKIKYMQDKYKKFVRARAIKNFEMELKIRQKKISDFTDDEIEVLIAEEERKIRSNHGKGGIKVALASVGLGWFI